MIDAESSYEGRYAAADTYMKKLRNRIGAGFPTALATFPYVDYHPGFPYSVFLGPRGAHYNLPQLYWHTIGTTVAEGYAHTFRFNRVYRRAIYPLGQTYDNPPLRQIRRFRRMAISYGLGGVSWWSWQETNSREWRALGRNIDTGRRRHPPTWQRLSAALEGQSRRPRRLGAGAPAGRRRVGSGHGLLRAQDAARGEALPALQWVRR